MSLAHLAPAQRWQIRGHVWLIALWSIGVAMGANALFRHAGLNDAPMIRHSLNALVLYFVGLIPAVLLYLHWHQTRAIRRADLLATEDEVVRYSGSKAEFDLLSDKKGLLMDSIAILTGALPFWVPSLFSILMYLILPFVFFAPLWFSEWFASGLAELVFEFVIGYALIRRADIPEPTALTYFTLVAKTWGYGLFILLSGFFIGLFRKFFP